MYSVVLMNSLRSRLVMVARADLMGLRTPSSLTYRNGRRDRCTGLRLRLLTAIVAELHIVQFVRLAPPSATVTSHGDFIQTFGKARRVIDVGVFVFGQRSARSEQFVPETVRAFSNVARDAGAFLSVAHFMALPYSRLIANLAESFKLSASIRNV